MLEVVARIDQLFCLRGESEMPPVTNNIEHSCQKCTATKDLLAIEGLIISSHQGSARKLRCLLCTTSKDLLVIQGLIISLATRDLRLVRSLVGWLQA